MRLTGLADAPATAPLLLLPLGRLGVRSRVWSDSVVMGFLAWRASAASGGSRGRLRSELASGPISLCAAMALPLIKL